MKLIKLNAIDSTNSYLKKLSMENVLEDRTIVWAESQTDGRGQHGSHWMSKEGESLTFSMFKRFGSLDVHDGFYIIMAASLGVAYTLKELHVPSVSIKWPNDIMSEHSKLCGLLVENQVHSGNIVSSIIGIGINVNNELFDLLPKAGSIYQTTGIRFALDDVLKAVVAHVEQQMERLIERDFKQLKSDYLNLLFKKDTIVVFEDQSGQRFNGIIRDVTHSGKLMVETESSSLSEFDLKEVTMLY